MRYWNESKSAWVTDGCATVEADGGFVRCECSHLSEFIVVEVPQSWDELIDDILEGLEVTFTWADVEQCLGRAEWSLVWLAVVSLAVLELVGLAYGIRRDRREIAFVEALVAGRTRDQKLRLGRRIASIMLGRPPPGGRPGAASQPQRSVSLPRRMTAPFSTRLSRPRAHSAAAAPRIVSPPRLSSIAVVTETSGDGSVRRSLALPSSSAAAPPPPAWSPRSQRGVVEAEVAGEESPAAAVEARPAARGRLAIRKSRSSSVK